MKGILWKNQIANAFDEQPAAYWRIERWLAGSRNLCFKSKGFDAKKNAKCKNMENKWANESMYGFWAFGYFCLMDPDGSRLAKLSMCLPVDVKMWFVFLLENFYRMIWVFIVVSKALVALSVGLLLTVTGNMCVPVGYSGVTLWQKWNNVKRCLEMPRSHDSSPSISCMAVSSWCSFFSHKHRIQNKSITPITKTHWASGMLVLL